MVGSESFKFGYWRLGDGYWVMGLINEGRGIGLCPGFAAVCRDELVGLCPDSIRTYMGRREKNSHFQSNLRVF